VTSATPPAFVYLFDIRNDIVWVERQLILIGCWEERKKLGLIWFGSILLGHNGI
jgi:hypothetical protein